MKSCRMGKLKYVSTFVDRHGVKRHRFRKTGLPSYYFANRFGSFDFMTEYRKCLRGEISTKKKKPRPRGTISTVETGIYDRIYIIGHETGPVKIGYTTNIEKRLQAIQTGYPYKLEIIASFRGGLREESIIHRRYSRSRLHGEWFERTQDIKEFIDLKLANSKIKNCLTKDKTLAK